MKRIFVPLCSALLFLCGCAGHLVVIRSSDWAPSKKFSVQIKIKQGLSYWEAFQPDSKDRFLYRIKEEFKKTSISVVDSNPDVVLLITDVKIGSFAEGFDVERLVIAAMVDQKEIFRIVYKQRPQMLPDDLFRYFNRPINLEQIATAVARNIARQLLKKN